MQPSQAVARLGERRVGHERFPQVKDVLLIHGGSHSDRLHPVKNPDQMGLEKLPDLGGLRRAVGQGRFSEVINDMPPQPLPGKVDQVLFLGGERNQPQFAVVAAHGIGPRLAQSKSHADLAPPAPIGLHATFRLGRARCGQPEQTGPRIRHTAEGQGGEQFPTCLFAVDHEAVCDGRLVGRMKDNSAVQWQKHRAVGSDRRQARQDAHRQEAEDRGLKLVAFDHRQTDGEFVSVGPQAQADADFLVGEAEPEIRAIAVRAAFIDRPGPAAGAALHLVVNKRLGERRCGPRHACNLVAEHG